MTMENDDNQLYSALFAVIFFDGQREIDLGSVLITPSMNFKAFQSLLSHKLGISPHQITTYFTPLNHHHQRRRPVTNKFDFAAVLPESSSTFFWVVLKRSRRSRRRRPKPEAFLPEADNFVLLRRNPNLDYFDLMERDSYLMSMNLNSHVYSDLRFPYFGSYGGGLAVGSTSDDEGSSSGGGSENRVVFCNVCWNAQTEGETPPFHWCKNDAVTMVYRSPAGPIAPPAKNKHG